MATAIIYGFGWLAMVHGMQGGVTKLKLNSGVGLVVPVLFDLACIAALIKWSFFS